MSTGARAPREVAQSFLFEGAVVGVEPVLSGHINRTFRVTTTGGAYILQCVNGFVFKDPEAVMRNIELVTAHLNDSYRADGIDPARRVLKLVDTIDGRRFLRDGRDLWRAYRAIEGATAHDTVRVPAHFYEAGRAFGEFQRRLSTLPGERLHETIPFFHDTPRRMTAFEAVVQEDPVGRVRTARAEIDAALSRRALAGALAQPLRRGELPIRVTHNDTKINNVMIDDVTGEGLCVIDLDTVMPGTALYDFGDAIRFGASTAAEDERDLDRVALDLDKYARFTGGFRSALGDALTEAERALMPVSALVMTYELAIRFLGDYLAGDPYFHVDDEAHNLRRARAQLKLLSDMEKKTDAMRAAADGAGETL